MNLVGLRGNIRRRQRVNCAVPSAYLQVTRRYGLLSMLVGHACVGQMSSTSQIITDRPDITESSVVIPAGSVQVESGVTWSLDHGAFTVDLSETLIRVGILGRTEIRLTPPNYVRAVNGSRRVIELCGSVHRVERADRTIGRSFQPLRHCRFRHSAPH